MHSLICELSEPKFFTDFLILFNFPAKKRNFARFRYTTLKSLAKSYHKLYTTCVVQILDNCASVWGLKTFQAIDNIQNRAMRYFLGVHRFAPTLALIGDTGWVPSVYRRWVSIIRFWNRLVLMDNTRLTKTVFIHDYYLCVKNWSSGIKQIMIKLGCVHNFNDISAINMSKAKSAVKYYYHIQQSVFYLSVKNRLSAI